MTCEYASAVTDTTKVITPNCGIDFYADDDGVQPTQKAMELELVTQCLIIIRVFCV
jgi:hypothetical protein